MSDLLSPDEPAVSSPEENLPPNVALAGAYPSRREAADHGLVILAADTPYWQVESDTRHCLYVEQERLAKITAELSAYEEEMRVWRVGGDAPPEHPAGFYIPYFGAILLSLAFVFQNYYEPWWRRWGAVDSQAMVAHGQWWRALTGLFLHGDWDHLLTNIVFGWWYGVLVASGLGNRLGWLLVLLSGVLANIAGALVYYGQAHRALGFSGAVFGALGLLVAQGLTQYGKSARDRLRKWAPLFAGTMLFALYGGVAEPGIDWVGHAFGFVAGVILGLVAVFFRRQSGRDHPRLAV